MKKDKKIWLGLAVLGIILLSKKATAPMMDHAHVKPAMEPQTKLDLPTTVSGRYHIRNKTA